MLHQLYCEIISDIHLYSLCDEEGPTNELEQKIRRRPLGEQTFQDDEVVSEKKRRDVLVINGDGVEIDFGQNDAGKKMVSLLTDVIEKNQDFFIIYNIGNHDDSKAFFKDLKAIQRKFPKNFLVHKDYTKIANVYIAHGDMENRYYNPIYHMRGFYKDESLGRSLKELARDVKHELGLNGGSFISKYYPLIEKNIINFYDAVANFPELVVNRFNRVHKKDFKPRGLLEDVNYVVLGHTHIPFVKQNGENKVTYINTGTPRGLGDKFNPFKFTLEVEVDKGRDELSVEDILAFSRPLAAENIEFLDFRKKVRRNIEDGFGPGVKIVQEVQGAMRGDGDLQNIL